MHLKNGGGIDGFNTQLREGGCQSRGYLHKQEKMFQHTAARRQLLVVTGYVFEVQTVSTHSRAEAAAAA